MVSPVFYDSKVRYTRIVLWRFCAKLIRFYSLNWSRGIGYLDSTLFWDLFVIDGCDCSRLAGFYSRFFCFGLFFLSFLQHCYIHWQSVMAYHVRRAGHVSAGDILFIKNEMKSKKEGQGRKKGSVFATGTTTASLHTHPDKSSKARRRRRKGKKSRARKVRTCLHLAWMYEWSESAHTAIFASDLRPSCSVLEGSESLRAAAGPDRARKRVADKLVATKSWLYYVEAGGVASS